MNTLNAIFLIINLGAGLINMVIAVHNAGDACANRAIAEQNNHNAEEILKVSYEVAQVCSDIRAEHDPTTQPPSQASAPTSAPTSKPPPNTLKSDSVRLNPNEASIQRIEASRDAYSAKGCWPASPD